MEHFKFDFLQPKDRQTFSSPAHPSKFTATDGGSLATVPSAAGGPDFTVIQSPDLILVTS